MNQQKGFSLTEVLASLLIVTTLVIALVQQQWQSKHLLNQLVIRAQGTQLLDQVEESLSVPAQKLPLIPSPYHLEMRHKNQAILIKLIWLEKLGITRKHSYISSAS